MEVINAIGRRKAAIARIYLSDGKGNITVNKKELKTYFPSDQLQYIVHQPLNLLEVTGKYDIKVNLDGGGFIKADENLQTSVPGVFAAGDVRVTPLRQIISAASDGAVAAYSAGKFLDHLE